MKSRAECQLGKIIPCDGVDGRGPFRGLDWREIKSWCPIEWAILRKTFLAKGIVSQVCIGIQVGGLMRDGYNVY